MSLRRRAARYVEGFSGLGAGAVSGRSDGEGVGSTWVPEVLREEFRASVRGLRELARGPDAAKSEGDESPDGTRHWNEHSGD